MTPMQLEMNLCILKVIVLRGILYTATSFPLEINPHWGGKNVFTIQGTGIIMNNLLLFQFRKYYEITWK